VDLSSCLEGDQCKPFLFQLKMRSKKGATNLFNLVVIIIVLIIAAIASMIGLSILSSVTQTSCKDAGYYWNTTNSQCYPNTTSGALLASTVTTNATKNAATGVSNITSQFGNIGLVAAAVIIIGLLVGGFVFLFKRRGGSM